MMAATVEEEWWKRIRSDSWHHRSAGCEECLPASLGERSWLLYSRSERTPQQRGDTFLRYGFFFCDLCRFVASALSTLGKNDLRFASCP